MLKTFLIPEQAVETNGEGPPLELGAAAGKRFSLTLTITRIVEQQSLDVSVWGSEDAAWGSKPLAAFPQKFYAGTHQLILDLHEHPAIKFIRGEWVVNRWGRGNPKPHFTFSLAIEERAGQAAA